MPFRVKLRRAPRGLINLFKNPEDFREIQRWFEDIAAVANEKLKIVGVVTASEFTPGIDIDEMDVDTDAGDVTINLPDGPEGKNYRIVNIGSSGNSVLLVPAAGTKLFGATETEALFDEEVLILTNQLEQGWW